MDVLKLIEEKKLAVVVLDIGDMKMEDTVTHHDVARRQLLDLAEIGQDVTTLRPIAELHEDHGDVLLWRLPICEAPDIGSCLDCNFDENKYTHWSLLPADLWERG